MRIVSLAPSNTELLYALGLGEQVVAVTSYCDFPNEAKLKPRVGSWITSETNHIAELNPDIILTNYFLPESLRGWKGPGKIVHVQPKTLQEVFDSTLMIGKAVQRSKRAESLLSKIKKQLSHLRSRAPSHHVRPRVYMEEWPVPPMASGNWVPELVEIAGGIPVIAKSGKPSADFEFSLLQRADPDIMIFHWCGYGTRWSKELVAKRKGWKELRAVKENKLFVIDDSLLNRPGPRLIEGVKQIQKILVSQ